jgi:hypothetical protein
VAQVVGAKQSFVRKPFPMLAILFGRSFASPLLLAAALLCLSPQSASAAESTGDKQIEEVGVHLDLTGGYVGGETMAQLEQALLQVTQMALLDQLGGSLAYIVNHQTQVEESLSTVIDSVLTKRGFTLEGLKLEPGVRTQLTVKLHLTEERIESFDVRFVMLGNTAVIDEVVAEDQETVASDLYSTIAKTPYGDNQWISGLISDAVTAKLAGMPAYRDFDQLVLVLPGPTTKVAVTFTPLDESSVITEYDLHARSRTLLATTLRPVEDEANHYLASLVGAPVSFIEEKQPELQQALFQYLVNCGALSGMCATAEMNLSIDGCVLTSELSVDSEQYIVAAQGRLDLWKHGSGERVGRLSLRGGVQPKPGWAAYIDADYFPGTGELYPMLGAGRILPRGFVGAGWDFKADAWRFQGDADLSRDIYVSGDIYSGGANKELSEVALHYRLKNAYELQLISNFKGEVYAALAANL